MNPNEQQMNNVPPSTPPQGGDTTNNKPPMHGEEKGVGGLIGSIIVVLIIVLGGLYLWGNKINKEMTAEDILSQPDTATSALNEQSTSTEVPAIEADLNATDLNNLDQDMQNIDNELNNL